MVPSRLIWNHSLMQITFLGTGTSHGVPLIGCRCAVCQSQDPKNYRRRSGLHVVAGGLHLQIDTPPDFRDQVLRYGVAQIDAVFITHSHADHIFGFDDIRRFSTSREDNLPVYGSPATVRDMRQKFAYVEKKSYGPNSVPRVRFITLEEPLRLTEDKKGVLVTPLPVWHGKEEVYGFRVDAEKKSMAYIPDCSKIPPSTKELLEELDLLILDALRDSPHPTHFSLEESLEEIRKLGAGQSFVTHLSHHFEHNKLSASMPPGVAVPWDGLKIEL